MAAQDEAGVDMADSCAESTPPEGKLEVVEEKCVEEIEKVFVGPYFTSRCNEKLWDDVRRENSHFKTRNVLEKLV